MKQKMEGKLELNVGMIVSRNYRLMRRLGTGAFGDIYLAVNTNKETEKLAVKIEESTAKHPQLCL
jgi:serine/threonine protein kinase